MAESASFHPPVELPADESPLSADAVLVLEEVYRLFDAGHPGTIEELAYSLKDRVKQVPSRLSSPDLAPFVARDTHQRLTPTLRAALKLRRESDLKLASDLFTFCREEYRPGGQPLEPARLPTELRAALPRLRTLLSQESFAWIDEQGRVSTSVSILDHESLSDYLLQRHGRGVTLRREPGHRMLKVTRLRLRGFRSYSDESVELNPGLTVIAGPNEAGKSNLVRALRFLKYAAWRGIQESARWQGGPAALFRDAPEVGTLSVEVDIEDDVAQFTYRAGLERAERRDIAVERLTRRGPGASRELVNQDRSGAAVLRGDKLEQVRLEDGKSALASLFDVTTSAEAIEVRDSIAGWALYELELSALLDERPFSPPGSEPALLSTGSNLPALLYGLAREDPASFQEVQRIFADLLPNNLAIEVGSDLLGAPAVSLRQSGLLNPLRQADASEGMLRLLALLGLAYLPVPPPLVCIEEPEKGLYPRLIEAVVDVMRSLAKRTQVVMTTHSVTLLNRLRPDEVLFVVRDQQGSHVQRLDTREDVKDFAERLGLGSQLLAGNLEDRAP